MRELCFVLHPRQNHFFVELAEALRAELEALGVATSTSAEGFPALRDGLVYVLIPPHEYFALAAPDERPTTAQLERTLFFGAEQPGTWFFEEDARLATGPHGALLDINAGSVRELRRRGFTAHHAPLGWTARWSRWDPDAPDAADGRDIDALHLGIYSWHRAQALAAAGPVLHHRRNHFVLGDDRSANSAGKAGFKVEDEKWSLLRLSRVLLNIHVAKRPYFEWLRIVEAIMNGAVVVSEHSAGFDPLRPVEHFHTARATSLGHIAEKLLEDEPDRLRLATQAWRFLHDEMPLRRTAELMANLAEDVAAGGAVRPAATAAPVDPPEQAVAAPEAEDRFPSPVADPEASIVRATLKDVRLDQLHLRRELTRLRTELHAGRPLPTARRVAQSASYAAARPRISVITALYNHADDVVDALESAARSTGVDLELVICDDGSADHSAAAVQEFQRRAPDVPCLLVQHPINRGLGHARNTALDFARGELAFVLDADNAVYPACLRRLADALDADPEASFAYSLLEVYGEDGPLGLKNAFQWEPERLRTGNYIDAMVLWRTHDLLAAGRYTGDRRLHGWEDYDLFCRVAENGGHGAFVPEILCRYHASGHSMVALTDISWRTAVSVLVERYPRLMSGVVPPL